MFTCNCINQARENLLEGVGVADRDCWELHGLKADGERRRDVVGEVRVNEDTPLPEDQRREEQR